MKYDIGHLIDMLSILYRKKTILGDNSFDEQYKEIKKSLNKENCNSDLIEQIVILANSNADIWHLEADIRKGNTAEMGLEEVGRRALQIRDKNKLRIGATNQINKITKSGYQDKKVEHCSS